MKGYHRAGNYEPANFLIFLSASGVGPEVTSPRPPTAVNHHPGKSFRSYLEGYLRRTRDDVNVRLTRDWFVATAARRAKVKADRWKYIVSCLKGQLGKRASDEVRFREFGSLSGSRTR